MNKNILSGFKGLFGKTEIKIPENKNKSSGSTGYTGMTGYTGTTGYTGMTGYSEPTKLSEIVCISDFEIQRSSKSDQKVTKFIKGQRYKTTSDCTESNIKGRIGITVYNDGTPFKCYSDKFMTIDDYRNSNIDFVLNDKV